MWFVLQAVPKRGVVTQGVTVTPYIKHFLVFVVLTHLTFAAFYFTVGTLTRNAKIVYGLGVLFYPLLITYNLVLLNNLPLQWRPVLDPLLMRWEKFEHSRSAEYMNHHIVVYDADLIVNRAAMILIAAVCLVILYRRFNTAERIRQRGAPYGGQSFNDRRKSLLQPGEFAGDGRRPDQAA
jgi:ABC-type transport system involved in multi-copper enzyme maturation permease subunit